MLEVEPGIELVHVDSRLLLLNKPAGLMAVPGRGEDKQDSLSRRVQQLYPDALIVHRLDMATSGLMLMARGLEAQRALSKLFETRQVYKRYVAVVDGDLSPEAPKTPNAQAWELIDLPIALDWPNRPLRIIESSHGKPSQTRWRVASFDPATNSTRVELEPLTGRSHQLRVHLKALGHPILGDMLYAPAEVSAKAPRLMLHASAIGFTHPASGELVQFEMKSDF